MKTKILLDTDIGSDIDDAIALAYLLAQPDCNLLGITTVSGMATQRAALASVLCQVAGKTVPIFPGSEQPLHVSARQTTAPQAEALTRWPHQENFRAGQAIDFLRQTIRQHPHEITLLSIGPLTNIALLLQADPEIALLLKGLVTMGGNFTRRISWASSPEWNMLLDPQAAALVYNTEFKTHHSIGLDVTCQVMLEAEQVRNRFQAPLLQPVLDFAGSWLKGNHKIVFHDPLAAATIFDSSICTFETGSVAVELVETNSAGVTHWQPAVPDGRHKVSLQVNSTRFFEHYFSVF